MNGNMHEKLNQIFSNVNDWLKFSETKNALIIVFNSSLIFGILNFYSVIKEESYIVYMLMVITMLLISIVVSLLSFIPQLKYPYISYGNPEDTDNLLFFAHIAKYTPAQYYEKIKSTLPDETKNEEFDMYYINQIVANAKIVTTKFEQFKISAWFTIGAFLTPLGMLLLFLYKKYFS